MALFQSFSRLPDAFFYGSGFFIFSLIGFVYGYFSGWSQGYADYDYTTRKSVAPEDEKR